MRESRWMRRITRRVQQCATPPPSASTSHAPAYLPLPTINSPVGPQRSFVAPTAPFRAPALASSWSTTYHHPRRAFSSATAPSLVSSPLSRCFVSHRPLITPVVLFWASLSTLLLPPSASSHTAPNLILALGCRRRRPQRPSRMLLSLSPSTTLAWCCRRHHRHPRPRPAFARLATIALCCLLRCDFFERQRLSVASATSFRVTAPAHHFCQSFRPPLHCDFSSATTRSSPPSRCVPSSLIAQPSPLLRLFEHQHLSLPLRPFDPAVYNIQAL